VTAIETAKILLVTASVSIAGAHAYATPASVPISGAPPVATSSTPGTAPNPAPIAHKPATLPSPRHFKLRRSSTRMPDPTGPQAQVALANSAARVQPSRYGYLNATQVWPYAAGALYQVYAAPGKVTDIALQEGEQLVSVSAGDTVRWIIGDTSSGKGDATRVHILVKPTRPGLRTNLVVNTDRRTYLVELTATELTWMASASWDYPQDRLLALKAKAARAQAAAPVASGLAIERLRFGYAITGDKPPWRPVRAFDDGEKVYIEFPAGIAQSELPPLFVVGPEGESDLVNYRVQAPYYVVDRLFAAAELRLGAKRQQVVRIVRTDGSTRRTPPS
jgi:P-type conjugative transfer protein TrbG